MNWEREREGVLKAYYDLLALVTGDGSKKRQAGTKPPWWKDDSHEAAIFSHLNKWKHGEKVDKASGAHPLVHLAWRALAIAYQETYGKVDPVESRDSDSTAYKADVACEDGDTEFVAGDCYLADCCQRHHGMDVAADGRKTIRLSTDVPSPRVRHLREFGLRG